MMASTASAHRVRANDNTYGNTYGMVCDDDCSLTVKFAFTASCAFTFFGSFYTFTS